MASCPGDRRDLEITGVTLEGDRLPRDIHPTLPMARSRMQMLVAACGRGPRQHGGKHQQWMQQHLQSVCSPVGYYSLPIGKPQSITSCQCSVHGFLSQRACGEFQHPKCVSVYLCDVDTKVEVIQTFKLQDES
jgi:hypothetical protein